MFHIVLNSCTSKFAKVVSFDNCVNIELLLLLRPYMAWYWGSQNDLLSPQTDFFFLCCYWHPCVSIDLLEPKQESHQNHQMLVVFLYNLALFTTFLWRKWPETRKQPIYINTISLTLDLVTCTLSNLSWDLKFFTDLIS